MTWFTDLQRELQRKRANPVLTKLPKAPFVSIGSTGEARLKKKTQSPGTDSTPRFFHLVQAVGAEQGIFIEAGKALAMLSPEGRQAVQGGAVDSARLRALAGDLVRRVMIERGLVPAGWLAVVVCEQCGPVWLAPESGPTVPACPWCGLYAAGHYFPRPAVQCGECRHFTRDTINPGGGLGECQASTRRPGLSFPHTKKPCPAWRPHESAVTGSNIRTELLVSGGENTPTVAA
jgi:hypothetical protein